MQQLAAKNAKQDGGSRGNGVEGDVAALGGRQVQPGVEGDADVVLPVPGRDAVVPGEEDEARRQVYQVLINDAGGADATTVAYAKQFKEAFGVSPRDYQEAHRVESVKSSLQNGSRVADAVYDAGYERFRLLYPALRPLEVT